MPDILVTSLTGLRAYQAALATTSHNISNVGTDGYSRQRVELNAVEPSQYGPTHIGEGVNVSNIQRIFDQFAVANIREFQSSFSRLETFESLASRVENLIADEQGSLMPAMEAFFGAMDDVANDPASNTPRVALLGAAENLEQRFVSLATEMRNLEQEIDNRIEFVVADINSTLNELARLNDSISRLSTSDSRPSDLLDQRDQLLKELSEKISVNVVEQADGILNVLVGTGQLLVTGSVATNLVTQADAEQPDRLAIAVQNTSGATVDVTNSLIGGQLGGLLDFRNNLLDSAQNRLGRVAMALADAFNSQHVEGYDLNGNFGSNFFSTAQPQVLGNSGNAPATGLPVVTVSDVTALTVSDYRVTFDGADYTILRLSDNTVVPPPGPTSGPGPVFAGVDGLDIDFTATGAVAGDSFFIRPTRQGAISFQTLVSDPGAVAAASPIRTTSSAANIGNMSISSGTVLDVTDPNLLNTVTITFNTPANTFDVFDVTGGAVIAAAVPYTDGMTVTANGWEVQLTGIPQPGDVLTVQENVGAASDNRNALLLSGLRTQQILDNNTATFEQGYAALTAEVGTVTSQVKIGLDVEQNLLDGAIQRRESISGVNLDEEAADLIRFQQAYQAVTRVIQTAQATFNSLLDAV